MIILPITLTAAGAAALLNLWLAIRIGRVRTQEKISMGDGGNERLIAAMRAQANFVEYTPFILILIAVLELALGQPLWLWIVSCLYILGRIAHGFGMGGWKPGRPIGTLISLLALVGLGGAALAIPYLFPSHVEVITSRMG